MKTLFDQTDFPIIDSHVPCLMILDFVPLNDDNYASGELLQIYHYPAKNSYDLPMSNLVIYDHKLITNFVLEYLKGNLFPHLINENIYNRTFLDYP